MRNYELTMENGAITWIEDTDANGNPIPGILYIPKEAVDFSADAWAHLGCEAEGIVVHEDNPEFSSAHNCLLTKNGKKLLKTCKNSDISQLTGLKGIGADAFQTMNTERDEFIFRIPDGVEVLDYRAFAISADKVEIIVPASVIYVNRLAFMITASAPILFLRAIPTCGSAHSERKQKHRTPILKCTGRCRPTCIPRQKTSPSPASPTPR